MKFYYPQDGLNPRLMSERGEEVWTPYTEGPFFISNMGRVWDAERDRELPQHEVSGRYAVNLRGIGKKYVHRLVIHAFEGPDRRTVHHLKDREDNRLCNLERRGRERLTKEEQKAVKARLREGIRPSQVAREFGLTTSHVAYYQG